MTEELLFLAHALGGLQLPLARFAALAPPDVHLIWRSSTNELDVPSSLFGCLDNKTPTLLYKPHTQPMARSSCGSSRCTFQMFQASKATRTSQKHLGAPAKGARLSRKSSVQCGSNSCSGAHACLGALLGAARQQSIAVHSSP